MATETFTVAFPTGTDEENLFQHIKLAMPAPFRCEREFEDIRALAAQYGLVMVTVRDWSAMTFLGTADGIWLDAQAKDRGTARQAGESNEALRERLRTIVDVVTRPALLASAQAVVDAEGIVGTVAMVELRRDRAFFGTNVADAGAGGTFSVTRDQAAFEPTAGYAGPPFRDIEETVAHKLVTSGAAAGANDGTFPITGLADNAALYVNGGLVAGLDAGVTWAVERFDRDDNQRTGFTRSYLSRGYRFGKSGRPHVIVFILPFGCTAATVASVQEMARQRAAAGVVTIVECRQNP